VKYRIQEKIHKKQGIFPQVLNKGRIGRIGQIGQMGQIGQIGQMGRMARMGQT